MSFRKSVLNYNSPPLSALGILQNYCSYETPLSGNFKQNLFDFIVHEVALDGSVAKFTSKSIPPLEEPPKPNSDELASYRSELIKIIGEEKYSLIDMLSSTAANADSHEVSSVHLPNFPDKDVRAAVHKFSRALFPLLHSDVIDLSDGEKAIRIFVKPKDGKKRGRGEELERISHWPPHRPNYVHAVLHKSNLTTSEVLSDLSIGLKTSAKNIGICGTKDKRACTSQFVSFYRIHPTRLSRVASSSRIRGYFLGNFSYKSEPLHLGGLKGNIFSVLLRNLSTEDPNVVSSVFSNWKSNGYRFYNYFGQQRFGNGPEGARTHDVGFKILSNDFSGALDIIFRPSPFDNQFLTKAKSLFSSGDVESALSILSEGRSEEKLLLESYMDQKKLGSVPNICAKKAILSLPPSRRSLYVHAVQSLLWNLVLSKRVARWGRKVAVGDLVLKDGISLDSVADDEALPFSGLDHPNEVNSDLSSNCNKRPKNDSLPGYEHLVRQLTQEDVNSGNFSLDNILLPTAGPNAIYPRHEFGSPAIFVELLSHMPTPSNDLTLIQKKIEDNIVLDEADFISIENFINTTFLSTDHRLSYSSRVRKAVMSATDVSFTLIKALPDSANALRSDFDILQDHTFTDYTKDNLDVKGPPALILSFMLEKSAYASMAIREICDY